MAWVVIMPNLADEMNLERSSTFSEREGSSLFFAVYGSAGLLPVSALEKVLEDMARDRRWLDSLLADGTVCLVEV